MCAFQWPCKDILKGDYFGTQIKGVAVIAALATIKQRIFAVSQAWIWSDSEHVDKVKELVSNTFLLRNFNCKYDANKVLSCQIFFYFSILT